MNIQQKRKLVRQITRIIRTVNVIGTFTKHNLRIEKLTTSRVIACQSAIALAQKYKGCNRNKKQRDIVNLEFKLIDAGLTAMKILNCIENELTKRQR